MTDRPDVDGIETRAKAATAGPWVWTKVAVEQSVTEYTLKGPDVLCRYWYDKSPTVDAEFIAHARQDIPALIEYIEALEAIIRERDEGDKRVWQKAREAIAELDRLDALAALGDEDG